MSTRVLFPLAFSAAILAAPGLPCAQSVTLDLREGDSVGFATLTSLAEKTISDSGAWVVEVHTDFADPATDVALLESGGQVRLREGDPLPVVTSSGNLAARFFGVQLDSDGNLTTLVSTYHGTSYGNVVLWNDVPLLVNGQPVPGVTPEEYFGWAFSARSNAQRQVLVIAHAYQGEVLYALDLDPSGAVLRTRKLLEENGFFGGSVFPIRALPQADNALALNHRGEWMTTVNTGPRSPTDSDWTTGSDGLVVLNGTVVAAEGAPSPVAGRSYKVLFPGTEVALNDFGRYAFSATLDGDMSTDFLLVENGQKFVQDGDVLPALAPHALAIASGTPIALTNSGDLFWFAATDDPDSTRDQAYMRNREVIVQEGVTQVAGLTVVRVSVESTAFAVSPSGRFWIGEVVLQGGLDAMIAADFGAAVPVPGCDSNPGTLFLADGKVLAGQTIELSMEGAPAVGTLPLLFASLGSPALGPSGCGLHTSLGELLVDPTQIVGRMIGPVFTGSPSTFSIAIPPDPALVDAKIYAQGLFLDAAHSLPGPDVTLTNGLALEIGAP